MENAIVSIHRSSFIVIDKKLYCVGIGWTEEDLLQLDIRIIKLWKLILHEIYHQWSNTVSDATFEICATSTQLKLKQSH